MEVLVTKLEAGEVVQAPAPTISNGGTVRIGTATPMFPPVRIAPPKVADREQVRIGTATPSFPPIRAR